MEEPCWGAEGRMVGLGKEGRWSWVVVGGRGEGGEGVGGGGGVVEDGGGEEGGEWERRAGCGAGVSARQRRG